MNQSNNTIKNIILNTTIFILVVLFNFGFANAASSQEIVNLTNINRTKNGLEALNININLTNAAQAKANDMFKDNYFAHIAPDGTTPWDFIKGAGYEYSYAGENLAIGYTDDQELVTDWMNSPLHRANIMNDKFTEIGVAVVNGTYENENTDIVVQMFGNPLEVAANNTNIDDNNIDAEVQGTEDVAVNDQNKPEETAQVENVTSTAEAVTPTVTTTPSVILTEKEQNIDNINSKNQFNINNIWIISLVGTGLVLATGTYLILRYRKNNQIA